jgi:hypothetical protein
VSSLWRQSAGSGTLAQEWAQLTPAWSVADALREPRTVLAALLLVGSMVLFSRRGGPRGVVGGPLHGLAHVGTVVVAVWVAAWLPVPAGWADEAEVAGRLCWAAAVGGVLATVVVSGYLYLAARLLDLHLNELFSAQSDEHHKSFLRLHIRDNGDLVVHPLKVPRVGTSWQVPAATNDGDPWITPTEPIDVHLIEAPVTIRREVPA